MSGVLWRSLRVPLTRRMARQASDHPTAEELGLKGWQVYFNSYTIDGRRNVSSFQEYSMSTLFNSAVGSYLQAYILYIHPGPLIFDLNYILHL